MSKLIITGVENGKISYIEGDEVVVTVESVQARVDEIKEKLYEAKITSAKTLEDDYLTKVKSIVDDTNNKIDELNRLKDLLISEETVKYEETISKLVSSGEIEALEKEEAKLSLILGGLKGSKEVEVEETPEVIEQVKPEAESTPVAVTIKVDPVENSQKSSLVQSSIPKPRRIII